MITPRVTVPVDALERVRDLLLERIHGSPARSPAHNARLEVEAMLSASVVPEGGAVWFGVTGATDETEALAVALFDARCPGIRMTDEDLHYYRAAAQRAMQAVTDELDTPALATREEAPALENPDEPSAPENARDWPSEEAPAEAGEDDGLFLLMKRDLYYRPNAMGYTGIKDHAGRYTKAEAENHADPISGVTAIAAIDAPDFSPACFDDLARAHLAKKLAQVTRELSALRAQPPALSGEGQ